MDDILDFIHEKYIFVTKYKLDDMLNNTDSILIYNIYSGLYITTGERQNNIMLKSIMCRSIVTYPYINNNITNNNYFTHYINGCIKNIKKLSKTLLIMINDNYIEYYFNKYLVDEYENITKYNKIEIMSCIEQFIQKDIAELSNNLIYKFNIPEKINTKIELSNNTLLKSNFNLYDYQIEDIKWMNKLTENINKENNKITYTKKRFYIYAKTLKYDTLTRQIYKVNIDEDNMLNDCIYQNHSYLGGNLVSDMGVGKSIITLYYILNNNIWSRNKYNKFLQHIVDNTCTYLYKKGKYMGKTCQKKKIDSYCKEHSNTLFIDKPNVTYIHQLFDINNFINDNYIISNASLIICPNYLCDQWINEYYNKFINNKRVIMLSLQNQYNIIKFGDLLTADIIIISYQFLLKIKTGKIDRFNIIQKIKNNNKILDSTKFNYIDIFKWESIFLDESHEIINLPKGREIINKINTLNSKTKWNITGTPCANKVNGYLDLLKFNIKNANTSPEFIQNTKFLFRKNIKHDIREIKQNTINENCNLIEFTQQERNIYESYNNNSNVNFLIKLCCDIELNQNTYALIKNCKTLDDIQVTMLKSSEYDKNNLCNELNLLEIERDNIEYLLNDLNDDILKLELKNKLSIIKKTITIKKDKYNIIETTYNYLLNVINNLKNNDEEYECPICLDTISDNMLTITKCGHKFCWDCLCKTYNINNKQEMKCPTCNTKLNKDQIYYMKTDKHDSNPQNKELSKFIEYCKSSKLGHILYFIKNLDKDDKIIIFSQWDIILNKVEYLLKKYNMKYISLNGTIYNKKKLIQKFKKEDINIVLLSSQHSSSGINLTEANKIIFIEPVYGTQQYRYSIESQAIGRVDRLGQHKSIDIYRFIIKDTIEQEIYNGSKEVFINLKI